MAINFSLPLDIPSDADKLINLCGVLDGNLRELETLLPIDIKRCGEHFTVYADSMLSKKPAQAAEILTQSIVQTLFSKAKGSISFDTIHATFHENRMQQNFKKNSKRASKNSSAQSATDSKANKIMPVELPKTLDETFATHSFNASRRVIRPRSHNQLAYIQSIENSDMVFGVGPAGTGKTYIAVAAAVSALELGRVERIILTRPAIEAGEKLGFLPGSVAEKVDPYLRPVYDALYDMLGLEKFQRHQERGIIEIAPLAFMRGRTLNQAFVILDEAQNTTTEQMKMFLTRVGYGSKMVINGDLTQTDLPKGKNSGLREACTLLQKVKGVSFTFFDSDDIVRHPLVAKVVEAYEGK